jgi:mRNA-degrading endonuclease toxin of MazEF toxin-antitoxin module
MFAPGDVVIAQLAGVVRMKTRPAVVVSTDLYHSTRPDVILAELTTQIDRATGPTDYVLQDWAAAGLHYPSACRMFLHTVPATSIRKIGHLTDRDWAEVQARLRLALAVA